MNNPYLHSKKLGFVGAGNMAQALIRGLLESKMVAADHVYVSNRTPGKTQKLKDLYGVHVCTSNEEVVENADIVILAVKPQDLLLAIEPLSQFFLQEQIVISLAAGVRMQTLEKNLPQTRLVRLMPNTPALIGKGLIGYLLNEQDPGLEATVEDLFSCLGKVIRMADEEQLEAFMVASSSGTGFIFEIMMYWQDWIEEHGFDPKVARDNCCPGAGNGLRSNHTKACSSTQRNSLRKHRQRTKSQRCRHHAYELACRSPAIRWHRNIRQAQCSVNLVTLICRLVWLGEDLGLGREANCRSHEYS